MERSKPAGIPRSLYWQSRGEASMNLLAFICLAVSVSAEQPTLTNLSGDAAEVKKAFDHSTGMVRLVLIVSPG
jgi:hypothetical protein